MGTRRPKCPGCGSVLGNHELRLTEPFRCPVCGDPLYVSRSYVWVSYWLSILLSVLLPLALGLRGLALILAAILLWVPITIIEIIVVRRIIPPKIGRHQPDVTLDGRQKPLL